ncbi:MAG: 2-oxoglutarate dehydrogenase E1 component, partial [Nitratireductor sp.]|nr:2-oxoglutarate dehydrogenase E1 component [Nitratireductor sp.]
MARQAENEAFELTSFLYGGNASYVEELHARYLDNPGSVSADWQEFFAGLKDNDEDVRANARGASWKRANWPIAANGELVSALDGDWGAVEKHIGEKVREKAQRNGVEISPEEVNRATRDSVRAIMMIRAYRMRG